MQSSADVSTRAPSLEKGYWSFLKQNTLFVLWALSCFTSDLGNSFSYLGLMAVLDGVSSNMSYTYLRLIDDFVPLLVSPFSGALVDYFDCRRTIICSEVLRGLNVGLFVLAYHMQSSAVLYTGVVLHAIFAAASGPAVTAYTPRIVAKHDLLLANSFSTVSSLLVSLLAFPLGGLVLASWGVDGNFGIDAACYLVAICLLIRLWVIQHRANKYEPLLNAEESVAADDGCTAPTNTEDWFICNAVHKWWNLFRGGLVYAHQHPDILKLTGIKGCVNVVLGSVMSIDFYYAYHVFTQDDDKIRGSQLLAYKVLFCAVVCCVVQYAMQRLTKREPDQMRAANVWGLLAVLMSVAGYALAERTHWSVWYVAGALFISGNQMTFILIDTILQTEVPSEMQGRVFAYSLGFRVAADALGTVAAGCVLTWWPNGGLTWFLVLLSAFFCTVLLYYRCLYIKSRQHTVVLSV